MRNLKILARILAVSANMKVEWNDESTAACDGSTVYLPNAWSYSADPKAAELLEGIMDHEAGGHGRHTDFEALKTWVQAQKRSQFARSLQNIFEDIFIERMAMRDRPGVASNLKKMVEILTSRGFFGKPETHQKVDGAQLIVCTLLISLRSEYLRGQDEHLGEFRKQIEVRANDVLGALWPAIWGIAKKSEVTTSTEENAVLADEIVKLIGDFASEDVDEEKAAGKDGVPSEEEPGELEVKAAKKVLETANQDMPETEITIGASEALSKGALGGGSDRLYDETAKQSIAPEAYPIAVKVKAKSDDLIEALLSQTKNERHIRFDGRRLSGRHLSRIKVGDARVFIKKEYAQGVKTAVSVLTDLSGSMQDQMIGSRTTCRAVAIGVMIGLADVLDEFDVPFALNTYCNSLGRYKGFEQDWEQIRRTKMTPRNGGSTISGAAMEAVLSDLACQSEERRLLVLITDGETSDQTRLESCYAEAIAQGIEVVSITIGRGAAGVIQLAKRFGFEATSCTNEAQIGNFVIERVLKSVTTA
jgi:cobaltochelatase CobT